MQWLLIVFWLSSTSPTVEHFASFAECSAAGTVLLEVPNAQSYVCVPFEGR